MAEPSGLIGKGIRVKGEVRGPGQLVIEGELDGRIQVDQLLIESTGVVTAEVEVENMTVHGRASGNIDAGRKLEVKATATVLGDVSATTLVIEEGAVFRGRVSMDVGLGDEV